MCDLRALLAAWITRGQSWRMEEEEAGGEVNLQFPCVGFAFVFVLVAVLIA